jgi:hypothetical protein
MWKRGQRANGAAVTSPGATTSIDGSPWKRGVRDGETARWEREGDGAGRGREREWHSFQFVGRGNWGFEEGEGRKENEKLLQ